MFFTHSYFSCAGSATKKTYSLLPASFPNVETIAAWLALPM